MHCVGHLGIIVSGLQALGIFLQLALEWFEPLKSLVAAVSLMSVNLDVLNLSGVFDMNRVATYGAKQVIAPLRVPFLVAGLLFRRRADAAAAVAATASGDLALIINAVGTCFNVFFIAIVSSALLPLVCYEHPCGSGASMRSSPIGAVLRG